MFALSAAAQVSFNVRHTRRGGNFLWGITSGLPGYVAVGEGGAILTSADGATWTRRSAGTGDWLLGVAYGAGQYVCVGDNGRILTSPDGIAWRNVPQSATRSRLNQVIFAGGRFVAVGEGGAIVTSEDGVGWTARQSGVTGWLRGVAHNYFAAAGKSIPYYVPWSFDTHLYVACGERGQFLVSYDGATWTRSTPFGERDLEATAFVGGRASGTFVSVGQDGSVGVTLFQLQTGKFGDFQGLRQWQNRSQVTSNPVRLRGIAVGADALFATGENGTIWMSPDPYSPWVKLETGTTANLVSGAYVGNSFYVVGADETILQSERLQVSRLRNISTRGSVGVGGESLISGFVVAGGARKTVLVRAVGPALTNFGVAGALAAPVLTVKDEAGRTLATNAGWSSAADAAAVASAAAPVGAFGFTAGSADSAVLVTLPAGSYTALVTGAENTRGEALVEVYDADGAANDGSRIVNISTRGLVGAGGGALIAGFNVGGTASRRVLIRAIGPTLREFGISAALAEPRLEVYRNPNSYATLTAQGGWSDGEAADEIRTAAAFAGSFALPDGSRDVAVIATLAPGGYTAVVRGVSDSSGVALVEVFDLP